MFKAHQAKDAIVLFNHLLVGKRKTGNALSHADYWAELIARLTIVRWDLKVFQAVHLTTAIRAAGKCQLQLALLKMVLPALRINYARAQALSHQILKDAARRNAQHHRGAYVLNAERDCLMFVIKMSATAYCKNVIMLQL